MENPAEKCVSGIVQTHGIGKWFLVCEPYQWHRGIVVLVPVHGPTSFVQHDQRLTREIRTINNLFFIGEARRCHYTTLPFSSTRFRRAGCVCLATAAITTISPRPMLCAAASESHRT